MKRLIFIFFLLFLLDGAGFSQTIYIADNNPGAIGGVNIFTGPTALTDAIAAALDDDIIHVIRGATDYGSVVINKRLNIFGIGLNPDIGGGARSIVSAVNITDPAASGTRISGLHITDVLNLGGVAGALGNLMIENSKIRWIQHVSGATTLSNLVIRNNVIASGFSSSSEHIDFLPGAISNVVVANNVIYGNEQGGQGGINASNGTIFDNNLFLGDGASSNLAWEVFTDNIVKNNIFYGQSPQGAVTVTGNTFQNNLSYSTPNDVFPSTNGNLSIANIEGSNPLLVNVPLSNVIDFSTFDPNLQTGSPAIGAGEGGTDLGVFGGGAPFDLFGTSLPIVQSLALPTTVSQGDNLPVNIKGRGN